MLTALVMSNAAEEGLAQHGAGVTLTPAACAIIAICILLALLIVTWAFKSVGTRH